MWNLESGKWNERQRRRVIPAQAGIHVSLKISGAARTEIPHSTLHIPNFVKGFS